MTYSSGLTGMAHAKCPAFYRRLTFFVAMFVFLQNVGTASLLHRLPNDPLQMSTHLSLYSWFACLLAILGVIGARRENATLVAIFANYLLIDVILCAVPRLMTLFFFPEIRGSICSIDSINARLQALQARGFFAGTENQVLAEQEMMQECSSVLLVIQILASLIVAGATLMQVVLAVKVRTYSTILQERQDMEEARIKSAVDTQSEKQTSYTDEPSKTYPDYMDEKRPLGD